MIITEILARNARMFVNDTALIEREPSCDIRRTLTWQTFDYQANQLARALIAMGIKKGDRVAHLMTNCIEWLPIYFGILRSGALAVPLNFSFEPQTIQRCINISEAKIIIFGPEFIEHIDNVKIDLDRLIQNYIFVGLETECPEYASFYSNLIAKYPFTDPQVPLDISEDAALYFTFGTTGIPEAILLTHRNLESAGITENHHHRQTQADNFLCISPLYQTDTQIHWFGNFIVGAKAVILKNIEPRWIIASVSEEQVTIVCLSVPGVLDILLSIKSGDVKLKDYKLDQWRLMHISSPPVPASLIKEWQEIFPHHQYDTNYGLTESTGPGCIHLGIENQHKVGAIGIPGFDWEFQIVDNEFKPVPPGTPGELIVKGPGVMKAYYRNPKASADILKNGWLLTGDMAQLDEDGFIWLVDCKEN